MTPEQALNLKPGDKVAHALIKGHYGTFMYREGPFFVAPPDSEILGNHYRLWWKGWNQYEPDKLDWTWDWAMLLPETPHIHSVIGDGDHDAA